MSIINYRTSLSFNRIRKDITEYTDTYTYNADENTMSFRYDNKDIVMHIDNFPFKPPKIDINTKPLIYCPSNFPRRLWDRYMHRYPDKCPCCKSILCGNNWTPSYRISHIFTEYNDFKEQLKTFAKILVFEHSFLPDDMIREIITFLI